MSYHLRTLIIAAAVGGASYALLRNRAKAFAAAVARRPKIATAIILAIALIPIIWTTRNVLHYGVNVPRQDDWEMASLIVKQRTGQLTWHDVFEQQQEARTVLPKLVFLLSAATGEWDTRQQMALSLIAAVLAAAGVVLLLRRSHLRLLSTAIVMWVAALCIFSPAQVEVWLLASGFPSFLPALFVIAALVALRARISVGAQFGTCVALSLASSFTLAHGLLAWALTFPVLLLMRRVPSWRWWLVAWGAAMTACAIAYFWGYSKPGYLPEVAPRLAAVDYLQFFLIFLGGGFAYAATAHPAVVAMCVGTLQLAILIAAMVYLVRRFHDQQIRNDVIPWLALAGYSVGAAILATIGRVGYGATYSLASRYVPFSIYLTIADAALIAILCRELPRRRVVLCANGVLCLAFAIVYARASATSLYFMRHDSANARLARGALLFSRVIDATAVLGKIYPPDPTLPARIAVALDDAKLLQPPLVRSAILNNLPHVESSVGGNVERQFAGWSALLSKKRPADCVLLAHETPAHQSIAFAVGDTLEPRYDIVKRFRADDLLWSGWRAHGVASDAKISAWAVDAEEAKVYRLGEETQSR
jgi:hypothetical protein